MVGTPGNTIAPRKARKAPAQAKPALQPTEPVHALARSRATNDPSGYIIPVDGRSLAARRFRDIVTSLIMDVSGGVDLPAPKLAIVRRAAHLIVWAELAEAEFASGKQLDIGAYTTAANSLRRLLADLGLERRAKPVESLSDIVASIVAKREVPSSDEAAND
jgi:hypothetical protein